jgi:hypothetical protein
MRYETVSRPGPSRGVRAEASAEAFSPLPPIAQGVGLKKESTFERIECGFPIIP